MDWSTSTTITHRLYGKKFIHTITEGEDGFCRYVRNENGWEKFGPAETVANGITLALAKKKAEEAEI